MSRGTRVLLIRHGHVEKDRFGAGLHMSGWTDLGLSDLGRRQASALAERLDAALFRAGMYSSPLRRAMETAEMLARQHDVALHTMKGLSEIHCGLADGMSIARVQELFPGLWEENLAQVNPDFRWPEGESYREFRSRCLRAIQEIAARHPGEAVPVVTHAGFIQQILGSIHEVSPARWDRFQPGNCSVTEVEWWAEGAAALRIDDRTLVEDIA